MRNSQKKIKVCGHRKDPWPIFLAKAIFVMCHAATDSFPVLIVVNSISSLNITYCFPVFSLSFIVL